MVYLIGAVKLQRRKEFFVTTIKTSIKELNVGDKTVKSQWELRSFEKYLIAIL